MKKLFPFLFTLIAISSLNSCFLFRPVQKTCPAYSENSEEKSPKIIHLIQEDQMVDTDS